MKTMECDLCIIAAGPAGLAAAVAAAEKEAEIIVLEKSNTTGGASNMGMGPLAVESKIQKKMLIGLTREEAFKKFMDYTHWRVDPRLVREYLCKSADTIEWLEGMGVEFAGAFRYFPQSEASWHVVKPESGEIGPRAAGTMMRLMTERAEELGVQFLYETPARELIREGDAITCVVAVDKDGEEIRIDCGAAVVATGGFGDNPDMIRELTSYEYGKSIFSKRVPGIAGDGLRMCWAVGADKTDCNMEVGYNCPSEGGYGTVITSHRQPNLMVNLQGERFMNEEILQNTTFASNVLTTQKNSVGFSIIDDSIKNQYVKNGFDTYGLVSHIENAEAYDLEMAKSQVEKDPYVFAADSLEELAEKTGIDKAALLSTVSEYNEACQSQDGLFFKERRYCKPLNGPRYYAVAFYPSGYGSLGGLRINYKAEVLNGSFDPIPGLYAAGTDACTIFGDSYVFILPGNTMGFALNSGRIAGERSVDYLVDLYGEE